MKKSSKQKLTEGFEDIMTNELGVEFVDVTPQKNIKGIKIVKEDEIEAYEQKSVLRYMGKLGRLPEFIKWFYGQTVLILNGKLCVFKDDIDRFLRSRK